MEVSAPIAAQLALLALSIHWGWSAATARRVWGLWSKQTIVWGWWFETPSRWLWRHFHVTIDQHMTLIAHIQKASNTISRSLGMMNRLKQYLPQNTLHTICNRSILPHIKYPILVCGFKATRISKLQKRSVRMMFCSKYNAHAEQLFMSLKVQDIFKMKALKFCCKYSEKKHYHFILMTCLTKLLIYTVMGLQNNEFKFSHQQNWASFHLLFSVSCMKPVPITMTLFIHVAISLSPFLFRCCICHIFKPSQIT